jgi:hypothetical protein
MRVDNTKTDQSSTNPPVEVPQPPAACHASVEFGVLKNLWQVISSSNESFMTTIDIVDGFYTFHGPFSDNINEIFDLIDEYRRQLENMRTNLLEVASEVDAGARMCEEINYSFDSLRNRLGYESERRSVNENVSDDESSLFSSVIESADENESK